MKMNLHHWVAVLFVTTYCSITILPSVNDLLTTPSPKYTSNLPCSTSCKKYTLLFIVSCDMSVAFVKVVVNVSEDEFCIVTVSVVVSALLSVIMDLCSVSELSTVYFVVT